MPPNQHVMGGGVPPKWRLPRPPHSGPLGTRPRGEPSLTLPRSPHFEAGQTVDHCPHGRLGWVDWGGCHSHQRDQRIRDQRLESPESWHSLKEHYWLEPEQEPTQPVHHSRPGCCHWGHCPLMAPARVEPHNGRYAL